MNLFEITNEFQRLYEMAASDDPAFADSLESLEFDLAEKAVGYVSVIQRLEMEADKADEIAAGFKAKGEARRNNAKRMKSAVLKAMTALGKKEMTDANGFTLKIIYNGGVQPLVIDHPEDVPENMTKITIEADKSKIRAYLKDNTCEWAHLEPRGQHLEIR